MSSIPRERENLATEGAQVPEWLARPFSLVSLLDMERFYADLFSKHLLLVQELSTAHGSSHEELNVVLDEEAKNIFTQRLVDLAGQCQKAKLKDSYEHILHAAASFSAKLQGRTYRDVNSLIEEIERVLLRELRKTLLVRIPQDHAYYFQRNELFGEEVESKFPQANKEITEAGNCYATGNYTACVFHLMRAVEHGARALVKQLNVARNLPHPVELCEWGVIFGELNKAVKALPSRKSVAVSERFAFYNHAIAQFGNFKDAWRNHVSHTRATYNAHTAMDILVNVRQFMQHLATRLREKK